MEEWMISLGISTITVIGILFVQRYKTDANISDIKEIKVAVTAINDRISTRIETHNKEDEKVHGKMYEKIDTMNQELAQHKIKLGSSPTMETVRAEFVSKEMFKQMEKHIDEKFDKLENGIEKILDELRNK